MEKRVNTDIDDRFQNILECIKIANISHFHVHRNVVDLAPLHVLCMLSVYACVINDGETEAGVQWSICRIVTTILLHTSEAYLYNDSNT